MARLPGMPPRVLDAGGGVMVDNMDNYWSNEIKSYDGQFHTGPDDRHDW